MLTNRRSRAAFAAATGAMLLSFAVDAHSQSLGEVARREAERRRDVQTASRVYTNEDLSAADVSISPRPVPVSEASPQGEAVPAGTPETRQTVVEEEPLTHQVNVRTVTPPREKRSEAYWRARARELREQLAKGNADLEAAQSGLAALEGAPQTPATAREREIAAALVQRLQRDVRSRQQDVTKLQMQAEFDGIPAEWIQ